MAVPGGMPGGHHSLWPDSGATSALPQHLLPPHTSPVSFSRRPRMSSLSFCSLIRHSALWTSRLRSLSGPGEWRLASSNNTRNSFRLLGTGVGAQNSFSQPWTLHAHTPAICQMPGDRPLRGGDWLLEHHPRQKGPEWKQEAIQPESKKGQDLRMGQ